MIAARLQPYPECRDSGVAWLGHIPKQWSVAPLKTLLTRLQTGMTPPTESVAYYENGTLPWFGPSSFSGGLGIGEPVKLLNERAVTEGRARCFAPLSVLLVGIGATIGKSALVNQRCSSNQQVMALEFTSGRVVSRYAAYSFRNLEGVFRDRAQYTTMPIMNQAEIGAYQLAVPLLHEQPQVANFLDYETAKIDALIEKQQHLIALLQEKRQAVISHAVTKGLNPDAPMRDSGVEWLGKVPTHWDVLAFKRVTSRVVVGIAEAATHAYAEVGVPIVRSTNIKTGVIDDSDVLFIKPEFAKKLESKALRAGDVVTTCTGANVGVSAVVPPSLHMSQCFTLVISSPLSTANAHYYSHFINSSAGQLYIALTAWGSGQPNISVPIIQNMTTVAPPPHEQAEIVRFIDRVSCKFENLESNAKQAVELLQERRTALISAAVTGKIDVRGWKPPALVAEAEVA